MMYNTLLIEAALTFLGLLGQNMTLERALEGDLAGARDLKPLFGTRIGFNLWHFKCFLHDTLLADSHRRTTYGAVWAIVSGSTAIFSDGKGTS